MPLLSAVGFPTGRDFLVPREKGTEVFLLSRDKGTTGKCKYPRNSLKLHLFLPNGIQKLFNVGTFC